MKKLFYVFAAAALCAACSQDTESLSASGPKLNDDNAITFSTYSNTAVTRGTVRTVADFNEKGIGVFAFYQPAIGGAAQSFNTYKKAIPDFMFNQQVKPNVTNTYTEADAIAHNATLTGAVSAGDEMTPEVKYSADEAAAYNAELTGAAKENDVINATHKAAVTSLTEGALFTKAEADEYNATLTGHVTTADVKTPAVTYTDATAAAYNATLSGAIKAGNVYGNIWSYSPVKYWPNNEDDQISFFAYAPYSSDKTWEEMGVKTDVNGKKMVLDFPIYSEVTAQEDYLFASPVLNQKKQATVPSTGATAGTHTVNFDFKHITSQVNLFVGVEQDKANQTPTAWTDANTDIVVKSIVFKNLSTGISYSYDLTTSPATESSDISDTNQDIELTSDNFVAEACNINTTNYAVAGFKQLNKTTDVMFLAPQALTEALVTYTVTTTDISSSQNCHEETYTRKADLSGVTLVAGSSYKFNFLIGMNSVKVSATITDWIDGGTTQYDVPANN